MGIPRRSARRNGKGGEDGGESLSFFICRHCPMCKRQSNCSINPDSGMTYGALIKEQG